MLKDLIKKLADKLELKQDDVMAKLGFTEESKIEDFRKTFDIYSIFETKDEHQKYFNEKTANQNQKIVELENIKKSYEEEKNKLSDVLKNNSERLSKIVNGEWASLGGKKQLDLNTLPEDFDFTNINKSLLKYADENQIGLPKINSIPKNDNKENKTTNNITVFGNTVV
ncbi:hypothetical protein [[Mycoplasma] testudinis]|uniref:hypothetical protein n=1 Tax=[Mycoplasma] testudinis TaxID=33924 RepID=UPI00047FBB8D|nr:hypothetical protein [[Mycoplasma] testudinis]